MGGSDTVCQDTIASQIRSQRILIILYIADVIDLSVCPMSVQPTECFLKLETPDRPRDRRSCYHHECVRVSVYYYILRLIRIML